MHHGRRLLTSLVCVLALGTAASQAAEVYKWVDESGRVVFSQTPPANRPADTLEVKPVMPPAPPAEATKPETPPAALEKDAAKDEKKDEKAETPPEVAAFPREEAEKQCQEAQRNLELLKGDSLLMTKDDNGDYRPLTTEERNKRVEEEQKRAKQFCVPGGAGKGK